MFAKHFHMTDHPFSEYLKVEHIQQDDRLAQAMARLHYFTEQGNLALITGETGVGKSTLIKLMLSTLPRNRYMGVYVHLTQVNSSCLLKSIAHQLGQPPRLSKQRVFTQILDKARTSDLTYILAIDESQLLSEEALTDLRLMISSAMDDVAPIKILLVGQDRLKNVLSQNNLTDLYHRINVRYHLKPFNKEQTKCYIDSHLRFVNAEPAIFTTETKELIHEYSHGIPRQINQLSTACLLNAASRNLHRVDEQLFAETMSEFPIQ